MFDVNLKWLNICVEMRHGLGIRNIITALQHGDCLF